MDLAQPHLRVSSHRNPEHVVIHKPERKFVERGIIRDLDQHIVLDHGNVIAAVDLVHCQSHEWLDRIVALEEQLDIHLLQPRMCGRAGGAHDAAINTKLEGFGRGVQDLEGMQFQFCVVDFLLSDGGDDGEDAAGRLVIACDEEVFSFFGGCYTMRMITSTNNR